MTREELDEHDDMLVIYRAKGHRDVRLELDDYEALIAQARRAIELEEQLSAARLTLAEMKGYLKGVER